MKKLMTVSDYYDSLTNEDRREFRKNVRVSSDLEYYQIVYRLKNNCWKRSELNLINDMLDRGGQDVILTN